MYSLDRGKGLLDSLFLITGLEDCQGVWVGVRGVGAGEVTQNGP